MASDSQIGWAPSWLWPDGGASGAKQTVGGTLILASCMCAAQSRVVWAASITHRQIELNGNIVVSLTAVTSYQLTADLLGIVIGHMIRRYPARVQQPSARPISCGEQPLPKVMLGLPAGSAHN